MGKWILVGIAVFFFLVGSNCVGDCQKIKPKLLPGIADTQMCKADLDTQAIEKFQKILNNYGHGNLKVLEGCAFATAKEVKEKTFIVLLRCTDQNGNVYLTYITFFKDDMKGIKTEPTGERDIKL